jgi:hypothetical protein
MSVDLSKVKQETIRICALQKQGAHAKMVPHKPWWFSANLWQNPVVLSPKHTTAALQM